MSQRPTPLTEDELAQAFAGTAAERFPPVLSPDQLADLLGLSVKTIYEWHGRGRLRGAARRRGKHLLIWRDRALNLLFTGPEWKP